MSSDSAVKLATQQSIKAYVDTNVTAQDLDISTDTGGPIAIDLDSETLAISGGEGIDTSSTGNAVTIAGEDASSSNKGMASFSTDNFSVSSGAVTIKDEGVANAELAHMAANTVKVRDANSSGDPSDKALASGEILIGDGTGFTAAGLSSDVSMTNAGVVTVTKIQGEPISSSTVANDQYLKYSSASSEWQKVNIVGDDKLSTKGDLLVYNTADSETAYKIADSSYPGTDGYALTALAAAENGVAWQPVTVADAAITNAKMANMAGGSVKVRDSASAGVPSDQVLTTTQILIGNGAGVAAAALSGDVTMSNTGAVTIASTAVENSMVATGIDAVKIADGTVTNAELQYINTLSSNAQTQISATVTVANAALPKAGGTMSGETIFADQLVTRPLIKDYAETVNAIGGTGGGTQDIDLTLGNVVTATVDTSTNTFTFSNPPATGRCGAFTLILTNGGSQTVNWPGTVDWAGGAAPGLTASGVDVIGFLTTDAGSRWYGFAGGLAMA